MEINCQNVWPIVQDQGFLEMDYMQDSHNGLSGIEDTRVKQVPLEMNDM